MAKTKGRKTWRSTMEKRRNDVGPALGAFLRAERHGFHWSRKYGAFVRISPHEGGALKPEAVFKVEVAPLDAPIPERGRNAPYLLWWSSPEMLTLIPDLQSLLRGRLLVTQTLFVDEDGERVTGPGLIVEKRCTR